LKETLQLSKSSKASARPSSVAPHCRAALSELVDTGPGVPMSERARHHLELGQLQVAQIAEVVQLVHFPHRPVERPLDGLAPDRDAGRRLLGP
jgi:hypothetical protein